MNKIISLAVFSICFCFTLASTRFDNSVTGYPLVSCEESEIRIEIETLKPFNGKLFVKGEYHNDHCSRTYANGIPLRSTAEGNKGSDGTDAHTDFNDALPRKDEQGSTLGNRGKHTVQDARINTESSKLIEDSSWRGAGGSMDHSKINRLPYSSAFGGSKAEEKKDIYERENENRIESGEIKVFPKNSQQKKDFRSLTSSLPNPEPNVCPPCSCEAADVRKRRDTNRLTFVVPLGQCSAKRERILHPPSLVTSFVVIVSFHESFITKLDRAYHIQCAYTESSMPVAAELNVSMADASSLNSSITPPKCEYDIRGPNGQAIQDVRVGDVVYHEWKCHTSVPGHFKMLIHDCYVESSPTEKYKIVDEDGCSLDKYTLSTPTYSEDSLSATVEAFMFKFPDRSSVDFQCSIKLCSIHDTDCAITTPPKCDGSTRKRRHVDLRKGDYAILNSNSLTVLDRDDRDLNEHFLDESQALEYIWPSNVDVCFSIAQFGILISSATFLSTISLAVFIAHSYIKRLEY